MSNYSSPSFWVKLRSGEKSMQISIHQEEIRRYNQEFGFQETKIHYHITRDDTLERLLDFDRRRISKPASENERLKTRVAMLGAEISDLRLENREMRQTFQAFESSVANQLRDNFILPLLRAGINSIPPEIEDKALPRLLNVNDLYEDKTISLRT